MEWQTPGETLGEGALIVGRVATAGGALPRHQDQLAAGAERVTNQPHSGVADGDPAGLQLCGERLRRQKACMSEMKGPDVRMADLREAIDPELAGSPVGTGDERIEAADEGADTDEDHNSSPSASTAFGKLSRRSGHCTMKRSAIG